MTCHSVIVCPWLISRKWDPPSVDSTWSRLLPSRSSCSLSQVSILASSTHHQGFSPRPVELIKDVKKWKNQSWGLHRRRISSRICIAHYSDTAFSDCLIQSGQVQAAKLLGDSKHAGLLIALQLLLDPQTHVSLRSMFCFHTKSSLAKLRKLNSRKKSWQMRTSKATTKTITAATVTAKAKSYVQTNAP